MDIAPLSPTLPKAVLPAEAPRPGTLTYLPDRPPAADRVEISLFGRVLYAMKEFGEANQSAAHNAAERLTDPTAQLPGIHATTRRILARRIESALARLNDPGTQTPGVDLLL